VASPCLHDGVCFDVNAADAAVDGAVVDAAALFRCDCTPYFTDAVCSTPVLKVISLAPASVSIFGRVLFQLYGEFAQTITLTHAHMHTHTHTHKSVSLLWFLRRIVTHHVDLHS
jgi:hypothetical protein